MSILLLVISCSKTPDIAGATSETTNGFITATVVNHNGDIEKRAKVFLRESIDDGGAELQVTSTNDEGVFRFDSLEESSYCIEVVSTSGYRGKHNFDEKQGLDTVMVSVPGSIIGQVAPSSEILTFSILGLGRNSLSKTANSSDAVGTIFIDSIPAGDVLVMAIDMKGDTVYYETISIESGEETDIGLIDTRVITATVVNPDGGIEVGARVFLRESELNGGGELQVTSTDSKGQFTFLNVVDSNYCIEAVSSIGYRGKHNYSIETGLDTVRVSVPGKITGLVAPSSEVLSLSLLGLNRQLTSSTPGSADTVGRIFIDSVPAGEIRLLAIDMLGDTVYNETVTVQSDLETDIGIIDTRVAFKKDSLVVQNILSFATDQTRDFNTLVKQRNGRIIELFLDSVGLTSLSPEVVKLPLEKLSIPGNNLKELPDFIGDFPELEYLDISRNNLTEFPVALTKLRRCSNIDMGNNKLTDLPDELFAMKSLMMLYVNENYLNNLPESKVKKINELSIDNKWQERQLR